MLASEWPSEQRGYLVGHGFTDEATIACHLAWSAPLEAMQLYRQAVEHLRLPFDTEHELVSKAIRVALYRAWNSRPLEHSV